VAFGIITLFKKEFAITESQQALIKSAVEKLAVECVCILRLSANKLFRFISHLEMF
jgi:hypothetical protein